MHVLVVCTGNICRSPTAERLLLRHAGALGVEGLTVSSAGTRAVVGYGMETTAREVLRGLGGDSAGFRARQLTPALSGAADLILTMTVRHRAEVLRDAPRAMRRTFTLLEARRLLVVPTTEPAGSTRWATDAPADASSTLAARLVQARGNQPQGQWVDDVDDPVGREPAVFTRVGVQIDQACAAIAGAIASA